VCRECFPGPATQPASLLPHVRGFPALRVLPASPTSTVASVSLRLVHSVDILGPLWTDQDGGGSPRCHDASISVRAVLLDPAGVSNSLAFCGSLLVPSKFSTLSASVCSCHEAQSLHLRYGPYFALPTLSPCRYLHEPKARFQAGRLIPLTWAGISPAGSARLSLAHRKTRECRRQEHSSPSSLETHTTTHPTHHAGCAPGGTHTRSRESLPHISG
jgi:hypothetical protein